MSRNLYFTSLEARSGKSVISLGLAELLVRRVERLGFFRPVIRSGDQADNDTDLMRRNYCPWLPYESMYAATNKEARDLSLNDQYDQLSAKTLRPQFGLLPVAITVDFGRAIVPSATSTLDGLMSRWITPF